MAKMFSAPARQHAIVGQDLFSVVDSLKRQNIFWSAELAKKAKQDKDEGENKNSKTKTNWLCRGNGNGVNDASLFRKDKQIMDTNFNEEKNMANDRQMANCAQSNFRLRVFTQNPQKSNIYASSTEMVKEDFSKMTKNQLQSGPNTKINDSRQPFNESKPSGVHPKASDSIRAKSEKWQI